MNNTLVQIGEVLKGAKSIYLFPHTNADGDAMGSCAALCIVLRKLGKECYILIEDDIADNLKFMDKGYTTFDPETIKEPDICMCVDCGEIDRFPTRKETFLKGKIKACIDHHITSKHFADYNYIDPEAAATGEIIFKLIKAMNVEIDKETGEAIFAAITTDTGNFQYSNTHKESFEIMVELMNSQIDINSVSNAIYQNCPLEQFVIKNMVMDTMEIFADGQSVIVYVTQEMLKKSNAKMEHTEGLIGELRGIKGVEISAFLKENEEGKIKVSMRAKSYADVAAICQKYAGGGHIKAAGCTLEMDMKSAIELMKSEITASFKESK